jgi:hypothetical protein
MSSDRRIVEVRLIVIALIDITNPEFTEAVAASSGSHIADVVSSEIVSNLESVSYVESVVAAQL